MLLARIAAYLFFMTAAPTAASEQGEWKLIAIDEDLNRHLVDKASIQIISKSVRSAWVRYEYHRSPAHQPSLDWIEAFENFDCNTRRRQLVLVLAHLKNGDVVVEDTVLAWRSVTEGSSSELEFDFVCSGG